MFFPWINTGVLAMGWCNFRAIQVTGVTNIDFGISDIEWHSTPTGTFLYAMSGPSGGMVAYEVVEGQGLVMVDQVMFPASYAGLDGSALSMVEIDGVSYVVPGQSGGNIIGYAINADGTLAAAETVIPDGATGGISGILSLPDAIYTFGDAIDQYTPQSVDTTQHQMTIGADATGTISHAISVVKNGQTYVIAASDEGNEIAVYLVDEGTGALTYNGGTGASLGLGLNDITGLETVTVDGATYVIVAASGSSSISVLEIDSSGALSPVEHLIDSTTDSRFGNVTALETVTVNGTTYVIAGGGDDGINLFTLLPDGRLVHLEAIADTTALGFDNVQAISAVVVGGEIQVFVTAQGDGGITQMVIATDEIGETWVGEVGQDSHTGTARDDILDGGLGNDTLSGGAGRDILVDGYGQDRLSGGAGADIFVLTYDGDTDTILDFTAGEDQLDLTAFFQLYDTSQIQVSSTSWGATLVYRDETIHIYSSTGLPLSSTDIFGAGISGPTRPPLVVATQILGTAADDILEGGIGEDTLMGLAGDDVLTADNGDDTIVGGAGDDVILGGAGNDIAEGGDGADRVRGGAGNDTLMGGTGSDKVYGARGADILYGDDGTDDIFGGDGKDTIYGGAGADTITGGNGNDTVYGGNGIDTVFLGLGNDVFHDTMQTGDFGNDTVSGGSGNDTIYGGGGADTFSGNGGDDWISGGTGQDTLYGGTGKDTLEGGNGADDLFGGDGADTIYGGNGNDVVEGGNGEDSVFLGAGNDVFIDTTQTGTAGRDTVFGGAGADTLQGGGGDDRFSGGNGADLITGGGGNDTLDGGNGADTLEGESGADLITGGSGSDTLDGGNGADILEGGGGRDQIEGGNGKDILSGGAGDDVLIGGAGADTFVFVGNGGDDVVDDFELGVDVLQIDTSRVSSFSDLELQQTIQGVEIDYGSGTIVLQGVSLSSLSADSFDFI